MKTLIAGLALILVVMGCASSTPKTSEELAQSDLIITDIQNAPVEYKLAYLDSGHLPRGTDASAARIRFLLNELSERTGDPQQGIADRTSQATAVLKSEYGKVVTHERFLEEAHAYYKTGGPKTSYNDLSTLLVLTLGR